MNLKELKDNAFNETKRLKSELSEAEKTFEALSKLKQPTDAKIASDASEYIKIDIKTGEFEVWDGSVGHSGPGSETKTGIIATIKIKNGVYLSTEQKSFIVKTVEFQHKAEKIVFK